MWRKTLIIAAVLGGIVAGVVLGLTSERVADNLRQRAILLARSEFGLEMEIEHLELRFVPLGVRLDGLRVKRPERDEDWIRVHRGEVQVRPWPSSAGAVVIEELEVDGLYFDARQIGAGEDEEEDEPSDFRVDVRRVGIWNAWVKADWDDGEADLREMDLRIVPLSRGGRELELHLRRGAVTIGKDAVDLEARVKADFSGTLDRPESLSLTAARIDLPRLALSADGSVRLDVDEPEVDVRLSADIDLAQMRELVSDLPELTGRANPAVRLSGPATSPEIRLELTSTDVHVARSEIGDVSVDAVYASDSIMLESFEIAHPRGGRLTGSGRVGLEEGFPLTADARLHDVLLQEVLESAGLEGSWIRMPLSSDVRATGSLSPLGVEIDLDGKVDRFEVLNASYRLSDARRFLVLENVPIKGRAAVTDSMVMINGISLGPDESLFDVEGMLHYRDGLDLRLRSESANLEWFGPIADVPFEGIGPIAATVEGPYKSPVVSATSEMSGLSILGYALGDTKATVIFENPTLQLDRVVVSRTGGGTLTGAGRMRFVEGEVFVEAAGDIENAELSDAMVDLKLPASLANRIRSRGSGRLLVGGSLARPEGVVHVDAPRASFDGVDLGALDLEVGFGTGDETLSVDVGLKKDTSLMEIRTAFLPDQTIRLVGDIANLPIANVRGLMGDAAIDGILSGRFNLTGPPAALDGSATAQVRGLTALGGNFGLSKMRAKISGGEAEVAASVLKGALLADGRVRLAGKWPYNLSSTFRDFDPTRIVDLGDQVESRATGSLFSQGALLEPTKVLADFRIDAWSIRVAGEQLNAMRTVNVQWANETLVIPEAAFAGPDIRLLVAGKVPLRSPMRLRVFGDGSLNALALMSNRVKRGRGNTKFSLDIGGLLERPTFDGELSIENGALTLSGARQQADAINARLTFSGAAANIDYARFDYGGGKVRLGGQFVFSPELGTEVSVRSEFERVSVNPAAGTTATLSGNLLLLGPLDDLRLRGDVNVDRARYTRNVDLAAIIPRRRSSPLQVPAIESTEVIDLAVKVKANNGIFISNNVLDAEFRADLTVTGTTNRVGLLGTVTPIEAKARYAGNLYELERGSVDFTEEYEIFSRFSVSARTEACGLDIKVDVFGDSETYNLSPSGSDENGPVDPQDVLLCLQFGSRVRDFTTGGAPVSSATVGGVNDEMAAAAGLDALWTVSGLDERVREVLPIDELRITNAWSPQAGGIRPRLVIGKDIGEAVRLQYWQSISFGGDQSAEEAYQAFSIQYALSKNATLEGNWLSEYQQDVPVTDLGLDLRLRWELR